MIEEVHMALLEQVMKATKIAGSEENVTTYISSAMWTRYRIGLQCCERPSVYGTKTIIIPSKREFAISKAHV